MNITESKRSLVVLDQSISLLKVILLPFIVYRLGSINVPPVDRYINPPISKKSAVGYSIVKFFCLLSLIGYCLTSVIIL